MRYIEGKTKEDEAFAKKYPVLASASSVVLTPLEGISSMFSSYNSMAKETKLRSSNVYSSSSVYRKKVSSILEEKYGNISSGIYDFGMSLADTGAFIAAEAVTGGNATLLASIALSYSSSYISTINEGLSRGLNTD